MQKQYFHTISGERFVSSGENEDSEGDADTNFISEYEDKLIDDISGVNVPEKIFMKLWNSHILQFHARNLPFLQICLEYIKEYKLQLSDLKPQWSLHLITLFEFNILTADDLIYLQVFLNNTL